jgi:hypothetical protein
MGYKGYVFLFVIVLIFPKPELALAAKPQLVCFSLNSAKRIINETGKTNEFIDSVGYISTIWGIIFDSKNNDLILVGEKDRSKPCLSFDDVILSIRNKDSIATKNNSGVSIEPIKKYKYNPFQQVRYFGGIKNTHIGEVFFESDLLLKQLSLGFRETKIIGFPSEWELMIDNEKAGRLYRPFDVHESLSYFFPVKVRINNSISDCAVLLSINLNVLTDDDLSTKFSTGSFGINYESIRKILDVNPNSEDAVYARIFNEHFEIIALQYPILHELQNLLALPGLFKSVLKSDTTIRNWESEYNYWKNVYKIKPNKTPDSIKTVSRSINGVKYDVSVTGGIFTKTDTINDIWSHLMLSKDPEVLKLAVLKSRPNSNSLVWEIPIGYGSPEEWSDTLKSRINSKYMQNITAAGLKQNRSNIFDIVANHNNLRPYSIIPGWKTPHDGKNLIEFNSSLTSSYGGFESYSPFKKFPIPNTIYSIGGQSVYNSTAAFGILNSIEYVFDNKVSFGIDFPVTLKLFSQDNPSPGGLNYDNILDLAAVVENPIVTNNIQIYDGITDGRWVLPSVLLSNSVQLPCYKKIYDTYVLGKEYANDTTFKYGITDLVTSHSLTSRIPLDDTFFLELDGSYQKDWTSANSPQNSFNYGGSLDMKIEKTLGIFFAITYGADYYKNTDVNNIKSWLKQGQLIQGSILFPGKGGYNTISMGYFFSNVSTSGGAFFINFDLSGVRLFNKRIWF